MELRLRHTVAEVAKQYLIIIKPHICEQAIRTSFATFRSFDAPVRATIQAMGSARKPVIVRRFSREWYAGYAAAAFGQESTALEVLDLHRKVLTIAWEAVKWVCYIRDFLPALTPPTRNACSKGDLPCDPGQQVCGCA